MKQIEEQRPESSFFYHKNFKDTEKLLLDFKDENIQQIDYVLLVGFHHIVGSQVEFIYPPLNEDKEQNLTP